MEKGRTKKMDIDLEAIISIVEYYCFKCSEYKKSGKHPKRFTKEIEDSISSNWHYFEKSKSALDAVCDISHLSCDTVINAWRIWRRLVSGEKLPSGETLERLFAL